jgi:hypothetical protein
LLKVPDDAGEVEEDVTGERDLEGEGDNYGLGKQNFPLGEVEK